MAAQAGLSLHYATLLEITCRGSFRYKPSSMLLLYVRAEKAMIRLHELSNFHISSPLYHINILLVINIDNKIHSKAVLDDKSTAGVDDEKNE